MVISHLGFKHWIADFHIEPLVFQVKVIMEGKAK